MAKYDSRLREEELKNRVANDWLAGFDCVYIIDTVGLYSLIGER